MKCARTALLFASALGLGAQSLRAPASTVGAGGKGVFSILLESPAGRAPAVLQWDLRVPPGVTVAANGIEPGRSAKSAKKTLTCMPRKNGSSGSRVTHTCVLAGGTDPIKNGVIALVHYSAHADSGGAPVRVAITGVLGAARNATRIDMPDIEAMIRPH